MLTVSNVSSLKMTVAFCYVDYIHSLPFRLALLVRPDRTRLGLLTGLVDRGFLDVAVDDLVLDLVWILKDQEEGEVQSLFVPILADQYVEFAGSMHLR